MRGSFPGRHAPDSHPGHLPDLSVGGHAQRLRLYPPAGLAAKKIKTSAIASMEVQ